jgi:2-dehydropantoate 2-reductase
MPSILIIGAGAIGGFFGSALARQGAKVSVVCRSDFPVVKQNGYHIRSPLLGEHRFVPHQVFASSSEAGLGFDYVVLATKVLTNTNRIELLRPAVGPRTVIVLIQNGIDIEAEVANAFAKNELLSGIAFIAIARTGPGEIHHQSVGSLTIGCYPSGISEAAQRLSALFESSGVPCKLTADIMTARWQKALWNATFNPISVLGGVLDTAQILRTPQSQAFVRKIMNEIADVASAAGYPLQREVIDALLAATQAMPPYKTSMALDFENGRPLEMDAILGNVVRTARRHEVAIPSLETIYALTQMVEGKKGIGDRG